MAFLSERGRGEDDLGVGPWFAREGLFKDTVLGICQDGPGVMQWSSKSADFREEGYAREAQRHGHYDLRRRGRVVPLDEDILMVFLSGW